ncbi:MAG: flagellin [Syntrophomonas sp.]|nr:flagellin [Syntrophomonas sp.]
MSFNQFNFTDISRFNRGDRFSLFLSASGEPANSDVDEIYLFSSADRRDIYPHNWRFNDGVLDNSNTELRTYQVDYTNGDIHEGVLDFDFADFHGGTGQGQIDNLKTPRVIEDTVVFESVYHQGIETAAAHHYTKLKDIAQFWTPDGRFLLEPPQELILQNGDQEARVMLYGEDELVDVLDRINQAIYLNLGQEDVVDEDERYKFVSFVDSSSSNSALDKMDGSLIVRTAIAGSKGEISLSAPEPLLNALGISVMRYASENEVEVEIRDAVNGKLLNTFKAESDSNIKGAISGKIGLKIDSSLGVSVDYSEGQEDFSWQGEENIQVTVQLVDNATVLQLGANPGQVEWIELMDASCTALGVDEVSLITRSHATKAIGELDEAIEKVSSQRAVLGALQNRLDHSINNLSVAHENLSASESRIRDTDMAKNMSAYVLKGIIGQAATAMLAQANQKPQMVLKLLGK